MDIVDRLESLSVSLNNSYSRQKTLNDASKEIQTLRAKVEVFSNQLIKIYEKGITENTYSEIKELIPELRNI